MCLICTSALSTILKVAICFHDTISPGPWHYNPLFFFQFNFFFPWRSSKLPGCAPGQKGLNWTISQRHLPAICDLSLSPSPLTVFVNTLEAPALLQEARSCSHALHNTLIHTASLLFWYFGSQQFKRNCALLFMKKKSTKGFQILKWKITRRLMFQNHFGHQLFTVQALQNSATTALLYFIYLLKQNWPSTALVYTALSTLQWDKGSSLHNTVVTEQLLHRAQDGLKNGWAALPLLHLGNQGPDAASCVSGTVWIKMQSPYKPRELWTCIRAGLLKTAESLSLFPLCPKDVQQQQGSSGSIHGTTSMGGSCFQLERRPLLARCHYSWHYSCYIQAVRQLYGHGSFCCHPSKMVCRESNTWVWKTMK